MVGRRLTPRASGLTLALGTLVLLAACSPDPDLLDRVATEEAIEVVIESDLSQSVTKVTCPERIPRGEGKTSRCEVTLGDVDGRLSLEVEQIADDGLDVTFIDALIDPAEVADELEQQLLATYPRTFTADCGSPGTQALAPGSTVPCTVTDGDDDGDDEREATATVEDAAGTLSFSVAGPPE